MKKNVLLTTMSILTNKNRVNYYYYEDKNNKIFVDGIGALEPGTKYYLSREHIDEIVVIGTKETIMKGVGGDKTVYDDLLRERENQELSPNSSAFEHYKYRIVEFLQSGDDTIATNIVNAQIAPVRKKELEKIYSRLYVSSEGSVVKQVKNPFLGEMGNDAIKDGKKEELEELEKIWRNLEVVVDEDINATYEKGEYQQYISNIQKVSEYEHGKIDNLKTTTECKEICKDIKKEYNLYLLEKLYLYTCLRNKVEELITRACDEELDELKKEKAEIDLAYITLHNTRKNLEMSYLQYFAYNKLEQSHRMKPLEENVRNAIALKFVDEQKFVDHYTIDNINGIVNTLYGVDENIDEINLYIDMQGGNRTSSYVRNAIISILNNQEPSCVHIKSIIGTEYNPIIKSGNPIVDESQRYRVTDLVSGMNAFVRYGKVDMIQSYCKDMGIKKGTSVDKLVSHMVDIDDAISVCNMQALPIAIQQLRNCLNSYNNFGMTGTLESRDKLYVENVFMILKDGIQKDYGRLLETKGANDEVDQLELISWCARKGFVQQALTLVQDKMPEVYFEEKILDYTFVNDSSNNNRNFFIENAGEKYEKRIHHKLFYNLAFSEVNGGALFEVFWRTQTPEVAQNRRNNKTSDFSIYKAKLAISKKELRIYIGDELKKCGITANKWRCDKGKIEHLKANMPKISDDVEFARQYCRFRTMENEFELHLRNSQNEQFYRDLLSVEALCDVTRERVDLHADYVCRSILGCMGEHEYEIQSRNNKNNTKTMKVNLSIHPKLVGKEKELDELFLLHEALHKERNCSNHASEKGVRLPAKSVKRAIDIYVDKMNEVMRVIKE